MWIQMTLNDLSDSKIFNNTEHHTASLQRLSFLLNWRLLTVFTLALYSLNFCTKIITIIFVRHYYCSDVSDFEKVYYFNMLADSEFHILTTPLAD